MAEEETQRLVDDSSEGVIARTASRQKLIIGFFVVGVVLVVTAAVALGVVFGGYAGDGNVGERKIPVMVWRDCSFWLNGTENGFALPNGTYDACGQMTFCTAGVGGYGYRMDGEDSCMSPGPTLRLRSGLRYGLVLCVDSEVGELTNVHTHGRYHLFNGFGLIRKGLHIPGTGNGDDVTRVVGPGDCIFYQYQLPEEVIV
jgi:FtsP/CotA-like multicopper oxidase with cupredoxin domain